VVSPFRWPVTAVVSILALVVAAGCDKTSTRMRSVREVRATFARDGLSLSVMERNGVSTMLLPTGFVRAVRRTPALGTPPRAPTYQVVVFTDRAWLRDLPRQWRQAQATLGGHPTRLSDVTMHRDNVFIFFVGGVASRERLKGILDDM
jgi:hypothetical protein